MQLAMPSIRLARLPFETRPDRAWIFPRGSVDARTFAWNVYSVAFKRAYRVRAPFDGEGVPWPRGTGMSRLASSLPGAAENIDALNRIVTQCDDHDAIRARIERMFRSPKHRRAGISLERIAAWWSALATDEVLAERTRAAGGAA